MNLTEAQIERYSRHILLKEVGPEGQEKLLKSKVLIIGAGGLGAPIAFYLAAAGIGTIGIVDADVVDLSNLQRQIIHFTSDLGRPKVESAKEKMLQLNPDVQVNTYHKMVNKDNILELISGYDFIVDGTDNFPIKFLINDACVISKKPFSHGGILKFEGQTLTYADSESACYRCVFHEPPPLNAVPTCSQAGVLGAIAGMLGTIQAAEVLRYLIGIGDLLKNRMLIFNALKMNFRTVSIKKRKNCPVCSEHPIIKNLIDYEQAVCSLKKP